MAEVQPPCFSGKCPNFSAEQQSAQPNQRLCLSTQGLVADTERVGFIGDEHCPLATIGYLGNAVDLVSIDASQNLATVAVIPEEEIV